MSAVITQNEVLSLGMALMAGMVGGALTILLLGALRHRKSRLVPQPVADRQVIDPDVAAELDAAAAQWAAVHGRPRSTRLVASKFHLAYWLAQQRQGRGSR